MADVTCPSCGSKKVILTLEYDECKDCGDLFNPLDEILDEIEADRRDEDSRDYDQKELERQIKETEAAFCRTEAVAPSSPDSIDGEIFGIENPGKSERFPG